MFLMLRPGGRLIVANYAAAVQDAGYREVYMDWEIKGRDEAEVVALTQTLPSDYVAQVRLYCDKNAVTNFVEVFRTN